MRCLIQRVSSADVKVDGQTIGEIGQGLLILVCAMQGDEESQAAQMAKKVTSLRIFADENGKMNRSLVDIQGQALIVSEFTLAADTSRGNRPGFSSAAAPDLGNQLYGRFADLVAEHGVTVAKGQFGAHMNVNLTNDGPVTIWLES